MGVRGGVSWWCVLVADADGTLTKEDLEQLDKKGKFFTKLDINHDSIVTAEEFERCGGAVGGV